MKFIRGQWVKYSNKIFPRYEKSHWEIKISENKYKIFHDWELANIYDELLKIKKEMKNGS